MKKLILLIAFTGCIIARGQQKMLSLEDALVKNRTTLAPENLKQLQFIYNSNDYVYLNKSNDQEYFVRGNFESKTTQPFLYLSDVNQLMKSASLDTFTSMPDIRFNRPGKWLIIYKGTKVEIDPETKKATVLIDKSTEAKSNIDESSAGWVAYTDNFNLFVKNLSTVKQITNDGKENLLYGTSVHQNEFGITKGTFWSNNGTQLAYYKMDQSMVPDYPIVDWTTRPAKVENVRYPMAGEKSHHVTLCVYDCIRSTNVQIKTGLPEEQYLTNVAWSPDDRFIFIAVLNREQNHMKLNQYNAVSGEFVKTLFEETDDKYVEPLVPMLFVKNNPDQFIWQSNRSGYNHLYLYNINGTLIKQLTTGEYEVLEVKGFDDKGANLYYISNQSSPLSKNLYCVNLTNNKTRLITNGSGVHTAQVSTGGKYILDNESNATTARTIRLIETATGKIKLLLEAKDPLSDYALGKMSIFTITNSTGTPLYCRMYKPVGFDSTKKYPVVVYWYGGPHNQLITAGYNGGAGDYWFQYMAEQGYIVFSMDVRGSDNRGKAFEQSIFRHAGKVQMEDMMSGINYLTALTYVDASKMGLFGWSYGGFMTIDFILNHPGIFKAAVAGGPVIDWSYYEIMYGERYMDMPKENPEGYAATDLTKKVGNLKDKLLVIHGLQDPVVLQQHSVKFVRAAIDKNVQVDYMIYPGHEHNVLGKDRAHLYQKVTDYFQQWLK